MENLSKMSCAPCKAGTPPLSSLKIAELLASIPGWSSPEGTRLYREFKFSNFLAALAFVNEVGEIAEAEDHHPDIVLKWGYVSVTLWTHSVGGLSENDFILAAKIDTID